MPADVAPRVGPVDGQLLRPARHRVVQRRVEGPDTVTLALDPVDEALPAPSAGQFCMLYAFGAGEAAISISGLPGDDGHLLHTVRAVGPGTRALCRSQVGDMVGVRGPFGTAWPSVDGRDALIVAGGIGLAALRPVIRACARRPDQSTTLLVGARRPTDLLYRHELARWGAQGVSVGLTVDVADRGWHGEVGVVTDLLRRTPFDVACTTALVCGPEVMMRLVAAALVAAGVPAERIAVSLERNMACGIRRCGHCQLGPLFVCADGPVAPWSVAGPLLGVRRR